MLVTKGLSNINVLFGRTTKKWGKLDGEEDETNKTENLKNGEKIMASQADE